MEGLKPLKLMVRWPGGQQRQEVEGDCCVRELQVVVGSLTGIAPERQRIQFGVPPSALPLADPDAPLRELGLERGDIVMVEPDQSAEPEPPTVSQAPHPTASGGRSFGSGAISGNLGSRDGSATVTATTLGEPIESAPPEEEQLHPTMASMQQQAAPKTALELYDLVVETWGEAVPADTCERIRNDIAEVEATAGADIVVKPVKDSPLHLEVRLKKFDQQSALGQDLEVLARACGRYPAAVELVVEFGLDYPHSPPFVRIFTPRLQYLTGNVTFGGSFNTFYTTPDGWQGGTAISLAQLLVQLREQLLQGNAQVDARNFQAAEKTSNALCYSEEEARAAESRVATHSDQIAGGQGELGKTGREFRSFPSSHFIQQTGKMFSRNFEMGNRVYLHKKVAGRAVASEGRVQVMEEMMLDNPDFKFPMYFELTTPNNVTTHVCPFEFQELPERDMVVLPSWLHKDLQLMPGQPVKLRCVQMRGQPVAIRVMPVSKAFSAVENPQAQLQWGLRRYGTLTIGDSIVVETAQGPTLLHVLGVQTDEGPLPPGCGTSIVPMGNSPLRVLCDFAPSPEDAPAEHSLMHMEMIVRSNEAPEQILAEVAAASGIKESRLRNLQCPEPGKLVFTIWDDGSTPSAAKLATELIVKWHQGRLLSSALDLAINDENYNTTLAALEDPDGKQLQQTLARAVPVGVEVAPGLDNEAADSPFLALGLHREASVSLVEERLSALGFAREDVRFVVNQTNGLSMSIAEKMLRTMRELESEHSHVSKDQIHFLIAASHGDLDLARSMLGQHNATRTTGPGVGGYSAAADTVDDEAILAQILEQSRSEFTEAQAQPGMLDTTDDDELLARMLAQSMEDR